MRNTTLWCFIIIFVAGNIIGMSIGYVPVIIQSYTDGTNCSYIGSDADDCAWADEGVCVWNPRISSCVYTAELNDNVTCDLIVDEAQCESHDESCIWTQTPFASGKSCRYQTGWRKQATAFVASMNVFGGLLGSFLSKAAITKAGVNNSIALSGITSVLACVLLIVGWHSYDDDTRLGLVLAGRFFSGFCVGMASAAVPIYVGDVAPRERAGVLGVGFQVFITFGIMTASLCGYGANPTLNDLHPRRAVTAMNIYSLVLSILLVPCAIFAEKPLFDDATRNSLLTFRQSAFLRLDTQGGKGADSPVGALAAEESRSRLFRRPLYVAVAVLIAAGQQLSGINMLISYVTQMAADLGMENPYLAGFILMIWNFLSTLVAIWLAYRMTAGNMFLLGELIAALSCFMVAIPICFFDSHDAGPRAFIITGVVIFIFAFEFGMGPSFYVLAQSMFPSEIRSSGCSFTIFMQFVFNFLVNFCYPILVKDFSGGASKPQDKGISIMFFIYGGIGLVLTIILRKVMQMIKDENREPGEEIGGPTETRDHLTQY
jgi:MFS family permease